MPSRSVRAVLPALPQPAALPPALAALALILGACSGATTPEPAARTAAPSEPAAGAVALADLDVETMVVRRTDLCADLPTSAVEAALAGEVRRSGTWADGEQAHLSPDVRDIAHEDGCRFDGPARTRAAAWVFVPPVSPGRAEELVEAAQGTAGGRRCRAVPDAASYGDPSVAQTCRSGPLRETRYAGLFGDAWLTCSLSAPRSVDRADLEERADAWCATVLLGAAPDQTTATG